MDSDGRQLEELVAFVEKTLLPQGLEVNTNERVFNDDGVQIAEFDIEIRGRVGSTSIAWLIECRDRPGDGPAPGSWIEQLSGRRTRFGFNKVTAVSTTGFAVGAVEFAQSQGIELREVEATGGCIAPANACSGAVEEVGTLFDDLLPNGPGKKVRLHVNYANDEDHFVVETSLGAIRVQAIVFEGDLRIKETLVPLSVTAEYRDAETGQPISQLAAFAPQAIHGMKFSMEMHRMAESGETHVILRRLRDDA